MERYSCRMGLARGRCGAGPVFETLILMAKEIIPIHFTRYGIDYKGWAKPSEQCHEDGHPKSYHVILNKVFFANLSPDRGKWVTDEPRPRDLVVAVGACLDHVYARG